MDPVCERTPPSLLSLDHLAGVQHRRRLHYAAEVGLKEAFKSLTGNTKETGKVGASVMATRIARGLRQVWALGISTLVF